MSDGPLFDRIYVVDWSASSRPSVKPEGSIWLACTTPRKDCLVEEERWFATRAEAVDALSRALERALSRGERALVGFDFPFGFPQGLSEALGGSVGWRTVWDHLTHAVSDDTRNRNNRFEVAARINRDTTGGLGPFYGHPRGIREEGLSRTQQGLFSYPVRTREGLLLSRLRRCDRLAGAATPWFLYGGPNSVGGQAITGIPRVAELRRRFPEAVRLWPLETGPSWGPANGAEAILAEVYPSLVGVSVMSGQVKDQAQVVELARVLCALDADGRLLSLLHAPQAFPESWKEEGWILGI